MSPPADPSAAPPGQPAAGVTLVLGGGGFKGMAHVGVLLGLERHGVRVDAIVGTSAGALMGAAFAQAGSAEALAQRVLAFVNGPEFRRKGFVGFGARRPAANGTPSLVARLFSGLKRQVALERMFRRSSAFGGAALRFVVQSLVPEGSLEELRLPLAIAAMDLLHGEEVLIRSGDVVSAVLASSSVPGFFPPVLREGRMLMDAGIVNNLPTRAARALGATRVVAVDLSSGLLDRQVQSTIGMDLLLRAQDISTCHANRRAGDMADVVLRPELGGRTWLDPSDPAAVIAAGEAAAQAALPEIRELLSGCQRG